MRRFLIVFTSILLVLLSCEFIYRGVIHLRKPLFKPSSMPHLGWEFTPGAVKQVKSREGEKFWYLINESGFRDRTNGPWAGWKPNATRIAFIGDSVTAGAEVPYESSYPYRVEQFLLKKNPVQIVDLAIDATNSVQHLALLKEKALPLQPEIILLGYVMNDTEVRSVEKMPALEFLMRKFSFGTFLSYRLSAWLRDETYQIWEKEASNKISKGCSSHEKSLLRNYAEGLPEKTAQSLSEMNHLSRQNQVRLGVILFPLQGQVKEICSLTAQDQLAFFLKEEGIPFLDLRTAFKDKSKARDLFVSGDPVHPNAEGHRVTAQAVSEWLIQEKLLKNEPSSSII